VPDEVVRTIGVVAEPEALVAAVTTRYAGLLDRVCLAAAGGGTRVVDEVVAGAAALSRH
jgi:hypothetical protein